METVPLRHVNGAPTHIEVPLFVLHQTGNCWWLYEKVSGQYEKVEVKHVPTLKPGDLINAVIAELGYERFEVQILRS